MFICPGVSGGPLLLFTFFAPIVCERENAVSTPGNVCLCQRLCRHSHNTWVIGCLLLLACHAINLRAKRKEHHNSCLHQNEAKLVFLTYNIPQKYCSGETF